MRPHIEHPGILTCARDRQKHDRAIGLDVVYGRVALLSLQMGCDQQRRAFSLAPISRCFHIGLHL
jgi:hypothetical protein